MRIGIDGSFHHVVFSWSGDSVVLTREDDYVTEVTNVARIEEQYRRVEESEQDVLLMRFYDHGGHVRAFFIDNDPVQTNVREVAGELEGLDEVFSWLLAPGYAYRQGDVGLYLCPELPETAELVPIGLYPERFLEVLSKRHGFEPEHACEFFASGDHYYVRVNGEASLIHPEHSALRLDRGLYELIGARGTPLPQFVGLRASEGRSLEEL